MSFWWDPVHLEDLQAGGAARSAPVAIRGNRPRGSPAR